MDDVSADSMRSHIIYYSFHMDSTILENETSLSGRSGRSGRNSSEKIPAILFGPEKRDGH